MKGKSALLFLTVLMALVLCGAVSAENVPLNTTHNGTVSGDLYINATQPVAWNDQPTDATSREFNTTYNLPTDESANGTDIQWAQVYVNIYSGSGSANWPANATILLDGDGDGVYEITLGNELLTSDNYSTDGTIYWINDHCFRVYSDYQLWYDVTGLITCTNPSVYVKTEQVDTESFDGRLKMIALVAAYNDGDYDKVDYWVNDGQDWISSGENSQTTFETRTVLANATNATLNTVALSSKDGSYNFNGAEFNGTDPVSPVNYFETHTWDVTNQITPGANSTLTYTAGSGSFKAVLATLTILKEYSEAPVADFTSNVTSGLESLTVQFIDNSTNAMVWEWDFDNDGVIDSYEQNPTYIYNTSGTFTVSLTVRGSGGSDTETKTNYIAVIPINYATYLGGTSDEVAYGIAVDNEGNIYLTGQTSSTDFPTTTDAYQTSHAGGTYDIFLAKFNSSGTLVYSTYLGGTSTDSGRDITVDSEGNVYLTGYTKSTDFPTTTDANQTSNTGSYDIFLAKFNSSGNLVYSTYLGGTSGDYGYDIAVDSEGNVYLTGYTTSTDFPTTTDAYQTSNTGGYDIFITKFNSNGTLLYSTYLGGTGTDYGSGIAVDNEGNVYITGQTTSTDFPVTTGALQTSNAGVDYDAFVSKLNANGTDLVYSTYLGGSADNSIETAKDIAVDSDGNAYIIGYTNSSDFPITTTAYQTTNQGGFMGDVILSKLNSDGTDLIYSTFFGGDRNDLGNAITIDSEGNVYFAGYTNSASFPVTSGAYQSVISSSYMEIFLAKLDFVSPVANFTADILSDYSPLTVQFTDTSTSETDLTTWEWDFDNDGTIDSTEQNPTYTYNTPGVYTVKLTVSNVGSSNSAVKTDYITVITPPDDTEAPTVTASPTSGNFSSAVQVTLSATDNYDINPKIYYTTDGTDPTTNSTQCNGAIDIIATTTLKFMGADRFGNVSPVQSQTYTINDTELPTVTANLVGGTYNIGTQVTLSAQDNIDPNPTIYYTTDGTDPTTSSTLYTGPVTLPENVTTILKFIAVDASGNISPVQNDTYTIADIEAPTVTDSRNGTTVTLSATDNADPNPAIYYTTDGSAPTTSSKPYTEPITIPQYVITLLNFIAVDASGNISPVQNRTYNTYTGDPWNGGRYYNGIDMETGYYAEGNIGIVISNGGTGYTWFAHNTPGTGTVTYTASALNIPEGATILAAYLYQAWTWYGYPGYTLVFNGYDMNQTAHYVDGDDGQDVFDVTAYFNATGNNTAVLTSTGGASYATILIVVYESASEPYRQIWINHGYDILYHDPATGYAMFNNVTTDKVANAEVTTITPSGGGDCGSMLFNGETINISGGGGSDPNYNYYDVTTALQNGTNELGVYGGSYLALATAIMTITLDTTAPEVSADITGGVYSTPQIVTLTATDDYDADPVIYYTLDGTDPTTSSSLYTEPISITDDVTLNYVAVDSANNTSPVQTETYTIDYIDADFTSNTTNGLAPLTVQFTDTSNGNITTWEWDFDNDGVVDSTEQNPTHTYDIVGTYTVKLTVTGPGGSSTTTKTGYISVNSAAPVARFISDLANGVAPLEVQFIDQSTGDVTGWEWDFQNDGIIDSTEQNPTHTYGTPGTYTVKLIVTGPAGSSSTTKMDYITVKYPVPVAEFTVDNTTGDVPLTVQFTDQSTNATSWEWDFQNDGLVDSTEQNPTYTYDTVGTYTVKLTVSNPDGSDEEIKTDYITVRALFVPWNDACESLDGWTTVGSSLSTSNVYEGSSSITGYSGGSTVSAERTISITDDRAKTLRFDAAATTSYGFNNGVKVYMDGQEMLSIPLNGAWNLYTIDLSEIALGDHTFKIQAYSEYSWASATFFLDNIWVISDEEVFSNIEVTPNEVNVTIGDDQQFSAQAYTQYLEKLSGKVFNWTSSNETVGTIDSNGLFTAHTAGTTTITATADGINSTTLVTVNYPVPVADFTVDTTHGVAPLTVQFTDTSSDATSWAWDFDGDGTIDSNSQNATWTYNNEGTYTVTLTVTGPGGSDTTTKTDYISIGKPDLEVTNLQVPASAVLGNSYQVLVDVANLGLSDSTFTVRLYDNGVSIGKQIINLLAGDNTTLNFNWTPSTVGTHYLQIIADPTNSVLESSELNNQVLEAVEITETRPDLQVNNLTLPNTPSLGTTYTVTADITNNGTNPTTFTVRFYEDNVSVAKQVITLDAGATTTLSFNWNPSSSGDHDLNVWADPTNSIDESDESNNQQNSTITVLGMPELAASNLQVPNNPELGTSYPVTVDVSNNGPNTTTFTVRFYEDGVSVGKQVITLDAGATTTLTFNWNPTTTGNHDLKVWIDPTNSITETNEINNIQNQTVTVTDTRPDIEVNNLTTPNNPTNGTSYPVTVDVANTGGSNVTFTVRLYEDGVSVGKQIVTLAPGASTTLLFLWTPTTTGSHELMIWADPANSIIETDETNNQQVNTVSVA